MDQQSAFENAMNQLASAAAKLRIKNSELRSKVERLKQPERIIQVSIPVKMDDGSTKIFDGYRVQYSSALGPYKGGIRFHQNVSLDEVKALSFWMSVKCGVAGLPMGGGKGGVIVDPKSLSKKELEGLSRGYVKALWRDLGPYVDVPAPDVNTNGQIMAWMGDEYKKQITNNPSTSLRAGKSNSKFKKLTRGEVSATFTGKPISRGGSKGRVEATARGGLYILQALLQKFKIQKSNIKNQGQNSKFKTIAVQGMGNVGGIFARSAQERGFIVVAISDSKGGVYNPEGLDVKMAEIWKQEKGSISDFPGPGRQLSITNDQLLELPVDILVPAALENVINEDNALKIKAKIILELANGPTTSGADKILHQRKITVVPDFLANSGGVTVSYFEWFQNLHNAHWTEKQVNLKLKEYMEKAFAKVWKSHINSHVDLRTAAYLVALTRILKAMK